MGKAAVTMTFQKCPKLEQPYHNICHNNSQATCFFSVPVGNISKHRSNGWISYLGGKS